MSNFKDISGGACKFGTSNKMARLAYSVDEAAAATGVGRTTLYGLISAGKLASTKIGKRRLIRAADLEALIGSPCEQAA